MSNFGEGLSSTTEHVLVGTNVIDLIRPTADSICSPDDLITPQNSDMVPELYLANERGPCGGVEMAEHVMDKLIDFRDGHEVETGERIGIFANHPPSKGADRAKFYEEAGVSFSTP